MAVAEVQFKGFKEFDRALARNPKVIREATGRYFIRAIAVLKSGTKNNPWGVGQSGGGSPVDTGHLRDNGHFTDIKPFVAKYGIDDTRAKYGKYVHEGTKYMIARPWLDNVFRSSQTKLSQLENKLLETVTDNLAK